MQPWDLKPLRHIFFTFLFLLSSLASIAQNNGEGTFKFANEKTKYFKVPFELINNTPVIQITINGVGPLKMILDTGMRDILLTELSMRDTLPLFYSREVELKGLGSMKGVKALYSGSNKIEVGEIISYNEVVKVLLEFSLDLSTHSGTKIHGIIGGNILKNFIAHFDYKHHEIIFYRRDYKRAHRYFKPKYTQDLVLHNNKPFINGLLFLQEGVTFPCKLLVDTGLTFPLWLIPESGGVNLKPEKVITGLLGESISNLIYGDIGRIHEIDIGRYKLEGPVCAYPNLEIFSEEYFPEGRTGSLGGEIIKRFNWTFDYHGKKVSIQRNTSFHTPLNYNMSGIEIETPIPELPIYIISYVAPNSPAKNAGVQVGDQIIKVNGQSVVNNIKLEDFIYFFYRREGRKVRLSVKRNGETKEFVFRLQKRI